MVSLLFGYLYQNLGLAVMVQCIRTHPAADFRELRGCNDAMAKNVPGYHVLALSISIVRYPHSIIDSQRHEQRVH